MEKRFKIDDGTSEMDSNERAIIFTRNALDSLHSDTYNTADYLTEKIALFDDLNTSLTIFDRITDIFYGFELNGADEHLLKLCEKKVRFKLRRIQLRDAHLN